MKEQIIKELSYKKIIRTCTVYNSDNKPTYNVIYALDSKRAYYLS